MDRFSNYADYKDLLLRISEIEEALALLPGSEKKNIFHKTGLPICRPLSKNARL